MELPEDFSDILKEATSFKKNKGEDEAIRFLLFILGKYDLDEYQICEILKKIKTYSFKSKEFHKDDIIGLFINYCDNASDMSKVDLLEQLADLYNRHGQASNAENTLSSAIANLNVNDGNNYLYKGQMLFRQRASTILDTNRSQRQKDIAYLYYYLVSEFTGIAGLLYMVGKQNIEKFFLSQDGYGDNSYSKFAMFNSFIESIQNTNYPFSNDNNSYEAVKRLNDNIDLSILSNKFIELSTRKFPKALGFEDEFFTSEFSDNRKFAISFANENNEIAFSLVIPAKAMDLADSYTNDFLSMLVDSDIKN